MDTTWSHCSSEFFHHFIIGAQWPSCRVLTQDRGGHEFETHRHHCVVSLSNTHLSLLSTVSPQEYPTQPDITEKIVDWDVKNQIKQTKTFYRGILQSNLLTTQCISYGPQTYTSIVTWIWIQHGHIMAP